MELFQKDLAQNLFQQAKTVPTIAIFLAKTRLGYKEVSRVEKTGKRGGPIKTENTTNVQHMPSPERVQEIIRIFKVNRIVSK